MSRLWTFSAIVVALGLCAALLAGCGATPAALSGPLSTGSLSSPTLPPSAAPTATEHATGLPPIDTPTSTPAGALLPTGSPAELPSVQPSPTRMPTDIPQPPTAVPVPQVLSFTANPTTTQNVGDAVHLAWQANGQRAELCPLIGTGPVACQEVPLAGERAFVVDEQALTYIGFALRVYGDATTALQTVELHPLCQALRQWFFANPPQRCPAEEALISYAAVQYFEHGWMVWVEETDEFYVFYDEPDEYGFQVVHRTVGLELKPGASEDHRVGEDPPPGLYEPVSGFGLLWRGEVYWPYEDGVRERLGWATAPESGFDTAYQCSTPAYPRLWNCFLLAPDGGVVHLHPDSTAGVRVLWEVW